MAFWSNFFQLQTNFGAVIDALLENPNEYTLDKLLEEEDILQEAKNENEKLIEYLTRKESLDKLILYITVEADPEAEVKRKFKYPFMSSEIFNLENGSIINAIYQHPELIESLFDFYEKPEPLNQALSTYVSSLLSILMKYDLTRILEMMKTRKDIITKLLQHTANASVMDLLLKFIASENSAALEWLNESQIIEQLVAKFDPKEQQITHEHASQVLVDIVVLINSILSSAQDLSVVLLDKLASEAILNTLFGYVTSEQGSASSTENGLKVFSSLLEFHISSKYDDERPIEQLPPYLKFVTDHLSEFHTLLVEPRKNGFGQKSLTLNEPVGQINPLGFQRLKVVEFFAILTHTNYHCIYKEMMQLGIFKTCIDLFFDYPWNNFLHSTVEWLVQGILSRDNDELKTHLLQDCKLIDKICEADRLNSEDCAKPKGTRRGYMGHVTSISIGILSSSSNNSTIEKILSEHEGWTKYLIGPLKEVLQKEGRDFSASDPIQD